MDPRRPACPALVPDQDGGAGKGEQNEAACREAPASTTRNGAQRGASRRPFVGTRTPRRPVCGKRSRGSVISFLSVFRCHIFTP